MMRPIEYAFRHTPYIVNAHLDILRSRYYIGIFPGNPGFLCDSGSFDNFHTNTNCSHPLAEALPQSISPVGIQVKKFLAVVLPAGGDPDGCVFQYYYSV